MRMKLFEDFGPQTELSVLKSYQVAQGLMVKFNIKQPTTGTTDAASPLFGFDLYDFEDHVFRSTTGFSSLDEAKWAALAAVLPDQRRAA